MVENEAGGKIKIGNRNKRNIKQVRFLIAHSCDERSGLWLGVRNKQRQFCLTG
jgi:hypothetical protein